MIVTEPVAADQLPTPGMVMVTPVPDVSETDHDRVTLAVPPLTTEDGLAEKLLIVGAGQGRTLTVTV